MRVIRLISRFRMSLVRFSSLGERDPRTKHNSGSKVAPHTDQMEAFEMA